MLRGLRGALGAGALLLMAALLGGCGGSDAGPSGAVTSFLAAEAAPPAAGEAPMLVGFRGKPGQTEEDDFRRAGCRVHRRFRLAPVVAVRMSAEQANRWRRDARVAYVEPDAVARASAQTTPWGIGRVAAPRLWTGGLTGSGVRVAIIDTGIEHTHPDLAASFAGGYNFVNDTTDPLDDHGHGTHVAGIVAAVTNDLGVVGVAPSVSLYGLKVLSASGEGSYSSIIAALQWCVDNGIQVANMSLGAPVPSTALEQACAAAYNAGVVLVAAAGNSGNAAGTGNSVEYPARFSSVIAVAATDSANARAAFSSTGPKVEVAAPGVNIRSTYMGDYMAISGTSMASPHVAGCAALAIAGGVAGAAQVRGRLRRATDLGVAGRDPLYGYGLVNALKAIGPASLPAPVARGARPPVPAAMYALLWPQSGNL